MTIMLWNNGQSYSSECIKFFDITPLTKEEAERLNEIYCEWCVYMDKPYIMGWSKDLELSDDQCYKTEPLLELIGDDYMIDEENVKRTDPETVEEFLTIAHKLNPNYKLLV